MTEFIDLRNMLDTIRSALGNEGDVSACWDGNFLIIIHSRPDLPDKDKFAAKFDNPSDYHLESKQKIIKGFVNAATAYFEQQDEQQ